MRFYKEPLLIIAFMILVAVCVQLIDERSKNAVADEKKPDTEQILVSVRVDGASFLMTGDPLKGTEKGYDGAALTTLQKQGWCIVSVNMTASAGVNGEQQSALVLLEKPKK